MAKMSYFLILNIETLLLSNSRHTQIRGVLISQMCWPPTFNIVLSTQFGLSSDKLDGKIEPDQSLF